MSTLDFLNGLEAPTSQVVNIDIDQIDADEAQPRTQFRPVDGQIDPDVQQALEELADDIAENTLLQPITVCEVNGRFKIIMGERRWRAFRLNRDRGVPNSQEIPVIIRQDITAARLRLAQLSENLQRSDLTDIETAMFLKETLEMFPDLQKQALAKVMNKSSQYVSRVLALLDPEWADVVGTGIITYASLLEQFRPLSKEAQEGLKRIARDENRPLTSGDIRAAKTAAKGKPLPTPSGKVDIDPVLARSVQDFVNQQAPEGESYTPSASAKAVPAPRGRIKDAGDEAVMPTGTSVLNVVAQQKREARLTVQQLETVLSYGALKNKSHAISLMLPVDELKHCIKKLGGVLPEDDSQLPTVLAETINRMG